MAGEGLSDAEFLRAMVTVLGPKRSAQLIGSLVVWQFLGARTYKDVERLELAERSTWFRARRDLATFREYLVSLGEDPGDVEQVEARVARAGRRAA
jgi:hypothetical protein